MGCWGTEVCNSDDAFDVMDELHDFVRTIMHRGNAAGPCSHCRPPHYLQYRYVIEVALQLDIKGLFRDPFFFDKAERDLVEMLENEEWHATWGDGGTSIKKAVRHQLKRLRARKKSRAAWIKRCTKRRDGRECFACGTSKEKQPKKRRSRRTGGPPKRSASRTRLKSKAKDKASFTPKPRRSGRKKKVG